jgi:DNA polymerase IV
LERKIIHIDMDAFYASIEQRDNPAIKGKPVAVGGDGPRSVVAAASYEARKFGVHSAMPSVIAKRRCPQLIIVHPRFQVYKEVSNQIREIFFEYTDLVEPLSLDEAFLDVTINKKEIASATDIALKIKEEIREKTNLTASAGVSINKFLAKIASDYKKPDGLFVIKPGQAEKFIEALPIEKFFGVGKVTSEKMHSIGINKGIDLKNFPLSELIRIFGKSGRFYFDIAHAIDERPVDPDDIRKSLSTEFTFEKDLISIQEILSELVNVENELLRRLDKTGVQGRTLTLKVKFEDFEQITRSKSQPLFYEPKTIHNTSVELAAAVNYKNKGVRLLGLSLSNLNTNDDKKSLQLELDFT